MKYIASVSFGKDSLAMLLRLIEENKKIDEVIFFDTEMEFMCIYSIMKKVVEILSNKGIKFTHLKSDKSFLHLMLYHQVNHRDNTKSCGYKWCGGACRWFTSYKTNAIKKYLNQQYGKGNYMEYIGIASDEKTRIQKSKKLLPLVEWNMTEKDCLEYCHEHGFFWYEGMYELYEILDHVSCWCCKNKNKNELQNLRKYLPVYYFALCELENRCQMFMKNVSLHELEKKFINQ